MKEESLGEYIIVRWALGLVLFVAAFMLFVYYDYNKAMEISKIFPTVGLISSVVLLGFGFDVFINFPRKIGEFITSLKEEKTGSINTKEKEKN